MSEMGGKRSLGLSAVPRSTGAKRTGDGDGETQSSPDIRATLDFADSAER
jgi:hypothetical protein